MAARKKQPLITSVEEAVRREVEALDVLPPGAGPLVAVALALGLELDAKNSATSKSMCSRALVEALDRLRELAPAKAASSPLDEIRARRDARLGLTPIETEFLGRDKKKPAHPPANPSNVSR